MPTQGAQRAAQAARAAASQSRRFADSKLLEVASKDAEAQCSRRMHSHTAAAARASLQSAMLQHKMAGTENALQVALGVVRSRVEEAATQESEAAALESRVSQLQAAGLLPQASDALAQVCVL